MAVNVRVQGLDAALRQLEGYSEQLKDKLKGAVQDHTEQMADTAEDLAAYATGNLKTSIETEYSSGGFFGRVKSEARGDHDQYYPFALEFGTYKMPAQPFLAPALESEKPRFIQTIKQIVKE